MKFALVICGPIASGKTAVVDFCHSELGFKVVSFGEYVKVLAKEAGMSTTRETLQDLGQSLYSSLGPSALLRAALKYAAITSDDRVVFDGVRHLGALAEIRRCSETSVAVFLTSDLLKRYQRHNARSSSAISPDEFVAIDGHQVEIGINELREHCELVIDTAHPQSEIQEVLRNWLTQIRTNQY